MGKKYFEYEVGPEDGPLKKFRRYEAAQCGSYERARKEDHRRCQGVRGHEGMHWRYTPSGWLIQWPYKKDIKGKFGIAHSLIPPDHKRYIHPKDMAEKYFRAFDRVVEVEARTSARS